MILDFGGSNNKGVAEFYRKFGAVDHTYFKYEKNNLSWSLKKIKQVRDQWLK